jgi:recombination protein RecR
MMKFCSICNNILYFEFCEFCSSALRDPSKICVVENTDIIPFVEEKNYRGLYHVIHGSLSPLHRISPNDLKIANLFPRLANSNQGKVKEIIIVANETTESRTTANYILRLLKPLGILISEIKFGIVNQVEIEVVQ